MERGEGRIGFVSSFDRRSGMATIYYPDRSGEVTSRLPVFAPFGILQELKKGEAVFVLHLSNGGEAGIVLGGYSAEGDVPMAGITASDGKLTLRDASGSISLKEIISKCR